MLCATTPCCLGQLSDRVGAPPAFIVAKDAGACPYSVGILIEWVTFLGTLHRPAAGADLGQVEFPMLSLLLLCELSAGKRLVLEKALPRYRRPGRPIAVSAVPFGPGIDIWRSCRFMEALMRSLCALPGGTGQFVPSRIGEYHCRLRHVGWEKCGNGLTSCPQGDCRGNFS